MKTGKGPLLFFVIAGMELSWLYAWAAFLTTSILNRSFPFPEAIAAFALAAAITLLSQGRGWRIIYIGGTQVFGFILAALRVVYVFHPWSHSTLSQAWLIEFFNTPRGPLEWLHLILVLFLTFMFWVGGVTVARRPTAYSTLCARFDLGMAAFALLFLTKFLVLYKGGIKIEDPLSQLLFLPFFLFGLLGIGLVRSRTTSPRDFLPGYQALGVILSFTVIVVLFGTGLVLFFLPHLSSAAETGYAILKTAARPLGPVLVSILRFILMRGAVRPEPSSGQTEGGVGELITPAESSWWMELLEKLLAWVLGGIVGLTVLIISCAALFFLFRWLLSRAPVSQRRQSSWYLISLWLERSRIFLCFFLRRIVRRIKGYKRAAQLYNDFLNWGRHSGLPHFLSETPTEYSLRLQNRFPSLRREIELITEAFTQEVYGEITLHEQQLDLAQSAWRRLRSPLHWPSRLKTWFLKPENHPL